MANLFDPLTVRGTTLRNRIGLSPMCQYCYSNGFSSDWHLVHLGARAVGGAGLVVSEATAVEARGRITPHDLGLWSDAQIEPLLRVTDFIKQQGAVPGIQIAHAGRKASINRPWDGGEPIPLGMPRGWQVIGPSAIAFAAGYQTPQQLSLEEILGIQHAFRDSAVRALSAGFEWLEIHAGHGYLIHSFYSPLSNQRVDRYGGSFENRIRFLLETVQMVRAVWPENRPLAVRISATEWIEGGWGITDSVALAQRLQSLGVDLVDCSSGGNVPMVKMPIGAGYQVPLSEAVHREANVMTAAVGLITSPMQADEIIRNGRADLVLLGREMLRDPYWPLHAAQSLRTTPAAPSQYLRAFPS